MANRRRVRSSPTKTAGEGAQDSNKRIRKTVDLGWSRNKNRNKQQHNEHDTNNDELIESSSEDENDVKDRRLQQQQEESDDDEEEVEEALDAKKIRLARQYLQKLESDDDESSGSEEDDEEADDVDQQDRLGRKLQRKRMKRQGTLEYSVAKRIAQDVTEIHSKAATTDLTNDAIVAMETTILQAKAWQEAGHVQYFRGHDLTPTCVALQQSTGEKAISGSKDHSVIYWDVETQKKIGQLCPSWKPNDTNTNTKARITTSNAAANTLTTSRNLGQVLAVACSDDGRYAAVGKRDATVTIFDLRIASSKQRRQQHNPSIVNTFTGHKGPVTCLAFRSQSRQLFSGSEDRCIRHYNLDEMLYVETLYGHQFGVTDIDCHLHELPVSVGRDRTARAWKLAEDSHLIFRGGAKVASAEAVSVVHDDWFLTGHEDGHLALWMTAKKRPVVSIDHAHGLRTGSEQQLATTTPVPGGLIGNGITSLAALKNSDVAASGSNDGYLRLWKVATGKTLADRGMEPLVKIPVFGYINGIAIGPKAKFCVVAVGQEPRLGRWNRIPKAKNRFGIIRLRTLQDGEVEVDDDQEQPETNLPTSTTTTNASPRVEEDDDGSEAEESS